MRPKISVVTACYNEEEGIGNCINSLLNQSKTPHEIIIVDGGSKDNTVQIVKDVQKRSKAIKLIHETGDDRSPANARNIGWKAATGDYILFLDADWEFEENFIENIEKHINGEDVDEKLLVRHPAISSVRGAFNRYSWYGRTMPKYYLKNMKDFKVLLRIIASLGIILLPFLIWNTYALYLLIFNIALILAIGMKTGITCYKNSRILSFLITIPLYVLFMFISSGIGLVSIPFLMLTGKYTTGR